MYPRSKMVESLLDQEIDTKFLVDKNLTMTPNGSRCILVRNRVFFPLMERMYNDRVKYKKLMIEEKKKGSNRSKQTLSILQSSVESENGLNSQ